MSDNSAEAVASLLLLHATREILPIGDLDQFLRSVYVYHSQRGFVCFLTSAVLDVFTLVVTICLSTFLLAFVNWNRIIHCQDEVSCNSESFIKSHILSSPTFFEVISVIYFAISIAAVTVYSVSRLIASVSMMLRVRHFFHNVLHISDDLLGVLSFHQILESIVDLQDRYRLSLSDDLTVDMILARLCRFDDILTSFSWIGALNFPYLPSNLDELCFSAPLTPNDYASLDDTNVVSDPSEAKFRAISLANLSNHGRLTHCWRWCFQWLWLESQYSTSLQQFRLRSFESERWRLRCWAILLLIALPWLVILMVSHLFFRYTDQLRRQQDVGFVVKSLSCR